MRSGDIEKAIELQEIILDGNILVYQGGMDDDPPPMPYRNIFPNIPESEEKIMIQVSTYREEYPSESVDLGVKRSVKAIVDYYVSKQEPQK